jgi:hypothetical protein
MKKAVSLAAIFLCVVLLSTRVARADEVIMNNGDRLSGDVVEKGEKFLELRTGYAGTIRIDMDQVLELRITSTGHAAAAAGEGGTFSGRVNVSLKSERGNTDSDDVGIDIDMTYRRGIHRFRAFAELEQDRKDGENTKEDWLLGGTYNYFLTGKLYLAGWVQLKHDEFADLSLRTSAGPFIGYQFFDSRPLNLLIEAGAIFVREEYGTEPDESYWGPGWHINFDKHVFGDFLQFYHEQRGLMNSEETDDWLWRSWTGFRVPLFGGLVGSAEAKFDYDSEPMGETDSTQATYRLKLGYEW